MQRNVFNKYLNKNKQNFKWKFKKKQGTCEECNAIEWDILNI